MRKNKTNFPFLYKKKSCKSKKLNFRLRDHRFYQFIFIFEHLSFVFKILFHLDVYKESKEFSNFARYYGIGCVDSTEYIWYFRLSNSWMWSLHVICLPVARFSINVCKKRRFIWCTFGCSRYLSKSSHSQWRISRSHETISFASGRSGFSATTMYKSEQPKPKFRFFPPPVAWRIHTKLSNFVWTPVSSSTSRMAASINCSSMGHTLEEKKNWGNWVNSE